MDYAFENQVLDAGRRELRRGGHLVPLEPQIFDLLQYLIRHRERVVSRDDLIAAVWNGRVVSDSTLSSRINAVRSAIGDNGKDQRLIKTLSRKGIRFVGSVREDSGPAGVLEHPMPAIGLSDRPSIAVLPFINLSGEPDQDYFSDGITEDIITELSRFSELFVIARNSSFQYRSKSLDLRQVGRELGVRYILEGSIRRAGNRVRITGQLIDAVTGVHRWAERYDREMKDVFGVQDEVARTIVSILAVHLRKAEAERTLTKPPATWQAYDYYLRAAETWVSFRSSIKLGELNATRALLECSIKLDPHYARAHALMADTHLTTWQAPLDGDYFNPAALDRAHQSAYCALQFDPSLPLAHALVGLVLSFKHQHDAAIAGFERAAMLNPNYTDWRFAQVLVMAGDSTRAIHVVRAYMRADPFYPAIAALWLGAAHYLLKRYSEALPHLREVVSRTPNSRAGHIWSAANYAQLERFDDAQREITEALRIEPKLTIDVARRLAAVCKYEKDSELYIDGLRKAGLPER